MVHLRAAPAFIVFLIFLLFSFKHNSSPEHQYPSFTFDVSSVVGAPWRCGVLTTHGGTAGIGSGHQPGREHDSTPRRGVEAPHGASASP